MRICRCPEVKDDLKRIRKKHRSIGVNVLRFERLLANGLDPSGRPIPNLGLSRNDGPALIVKSRIHLAEEKIGKSSGPRYVYEKFVYNDEVWCCCIGIYLHGEYGSDSNEEQVVRKMVKDRFGYQEDWVIEFLEVDL